MSTASQQPYWRTKRGLPTSLRSNSSPDSSRVGSRPFASVSKHLERRQPARRGRVPFLSRSAGRRILLSAYDAQVATESRDCGPRLVDATIARCQEALRLRTPNETSSLRLSLRSPTVTSTIIRALSCARRFFGISWGNATDWTFSMLAAAMADSVSSGPKRRGRSHFSTALRQCCRSLGKMHQADPPRALSTSRPIFESSPMWGATM